MTNTTKMPHQHNQRIKEIQRQRSLWRDIAEGIVTMGGILLVWLCIWAATELSEWAYTLDLENHRLKSELHEEKTAYKAAFMQDAMDRKRKDREREQAIKDLCKRDKHGCKIMAAK